MVMEPANSPAGISRADTRNGSVSARGRPCAFADRMSPMFWTSQRRRYAPRIGFPAKGQDSNAILLRRTVVRLMAISRSGAPWSEAALALISGPYGVASRVLVISLTSLAATRAGYDSFGRNSGKWTRRRPRALAYVELDTGPLGEERADLVLAEPQELVERQVEPPVAVRGLGDETAQDRHGVVGVEVLPRRSAEHGGVLRAPDDVELLSEPVGGERHHPLERRRVLGVLGELRQGLADRGEGLGGLALPGLVDELPRLELRGRELLGPFPGRVGLRQLLALVDELADPPLTLVEDRLLLGVAELPLVVELSLGAESDLLDQPLQGHGAVPLRGCGGAGSRPARTPGSRASRE